MEVHKYHALGNDYLVYDPKFNSMELNEERIKLICDRNFGVGSDGILYGPEFRDGKPVVRIFNPDGGEAEKSGSGVIFSLGRMPDMTEQKFTLVTQSGEVQGISERIRDYLKVPGQDHSIAWRSLAGLDRMVVTITNSTERLIMLLACPSGIPIASFLWPRSAKSWPASWDLMWSTQRTSPTGSICSS